MRETLVIIVGLAVIGVVSIYGIIENTDILARMGLQEEIPANQDDESAGEEGFQAPASWQVVLSERFDFTYKHPRDWSFASETDELSPQFSAYVKPAGVPVTPPFTHQANVTNVSVFPRGIPTEGLFGPTRSVEFDPGFAIDREESRVYMLENGVPFAAYLVPVNPPESWNASGFVWLRIYIDDLETTCVDTAGIQLAPVDCDPLTQDHAVIRRGSVDRSLWETEQNIVRTLSFQ